MKILRSTLLVLIIAAIVFYLGDLIVFQFRGGPTKTISVDQLIAVPLKGNKTEYDLTGPADVSCARAIFPQGSWNPCWYVEKNKKKPIQY